MIAGGGYEESLSRQVKRCKGKRKKEKSLKQKPKAYWL